MMLLGDKIAKQVQTDDSKSTTQAAADHVCRRGFTHLIVVTLHSLTCSQIGTTKDNTGSTLDSTQNDTSAGSGSIIDSVKHAVGMDGSTKQ